ncbi:MAG TPA: hypothetical protein VKM72_14695 [Thermoanaerobaculia bacterium]|nr:hypothetical protein [Thermoanaerobaculia bacterium]
MRTIVITAIFSSFGFDRLRLASHLSNGAWFKVGEHGKKIGDQREQICEAVRLRPENSDSQRSILKLLLA